MNATHFRELRVWQEAMVLARLVYKIAALLPIEERFGLRTQMQRAAVSIPSNVAEGNARHSRRDYARFVSTASGSLAELQTQLLLARDLYALDAADLDVCLSACERVSKMLYRLWQSLAHDGADRSPVPGPRSPVPSPESRVSEDTEEYL